MIVRVLLIISKNKTLFFIAMMKTFYCCIFIFLSSSVADCHAAVAKASWIKVYGTMSQVFANSVSLWAIDAKLKAYYCTRPCTGNWIHVGDSMVNIDVEAFHLWGIGNDGFPYRKGMENSGEWAKHTHIPNTIDIAAGRDSYMWFIHNNKEVTWLQHYTSPLHKVPGKFDQIDANGQYVYALNRTTSTISSRPIHGRGEWRVIPGKMKYVTAGIHDIFAIGVDDKLYRCNIPCAGVWELMEFPEEVGLTQIDTTIDALFAVTSNGVIFRHELPL